MRTVRKVVNALLPFVRSVRTDHVSAIQAVVWSFFTTVSLVGTSLRDVGDTAQAVLPGGKYNTAEGIVALLLRHRHTERPMSRLA